MKLLTKTALISGLLLLGSCHFAASMPAVQTVCENDRNAQGQITSYIEYLGNYAGCVERFCKDSQSESCVKKNCATQLNTFNSFQDQINRSPDPCLTFLKPVGDNKRA